MAIMGCQILGIQEIHILRLRENLNIMRLVNIRNIWSVFSIWTV